MVDLCNNLTHLAVFNFYLFYYNSVGVFQSYDLVRSNPVESFLVHQLYVRTFHIDLRGECDIANAFLFVFGEVGHWNFYLLH